MSKIKALQVHQHYDVAPLGSRSERVQYRSGSSDGEDGKGKKGGKNQKGERGRGDYQRNKIDPIVEESSGFEVSNYYHIIYWC